MKELLHLKFGTKDGLEPEHIDVGTMRVSLHVDNEDLLHVVITADERYTDNEGQIIVYTDVYIGATDTE
jgi:hypothetical protein